ncbi:MAG: hypothetical protein JO122_11985 [Acetobacteraceae bacterium]|nr:hypothetical protein [Acetobacteraceae bacterium]
MVVEENNLQVQIAALRRTPGEGWIITVPGRGYRLAEVPPKAGPSRSHATPETPSVAVLAFSDMSGDPAQDYLADGIATIVLPPAQRSLMLDPEDAGAHTCVGWVLNTAGDNDATLVQADEVLRYNPNYAEAERLKGGILVWNNRPEEGRKILTTYIRHNPRDPRKWQALLHVKVVSYLLKDYAASIEAGRQVRRVNPTLPLKYRLVTYRWLVAGLGQLGRIAEAQHAIDEARALVSAEELNSVFTRKVPWQRESDLLHLLEGLRKAGWLA